jgi:hypothetical protein
MTMRFFSVAGGVRGVPVVLQMVPGAKGAPLEPPLELPLELPLEPPLLPPLEPPLLPPLEPPLEPPLLLPPLEPPLLPPLELPPLEPPLPPPLEPPLLPLLPPSGEALDAVGLLLHAAALRSAAPATKEPSARRERAFMSRASWDSRGRT